MKEELNKLNKLNKFKNLNINNNFINDGQINNNKIKDKEKENNISENNNIKEKNYDINADKSNESIAMMPSSIGLVKNKKTDKVKIIEFIRIIGEHENTADFIIELNNGFYISGGENTLNIYNSNFVEITKKKDFNDKILKIGEKIDSTEKNEDNIKIFMVLDKEFDILNIDKKTLETDNKRFQMTDKSFINFIEMNEDNYIMSGEGGTFYYRNLFSNQKAECKITEKIYTNGLKINNIIAILTSNKLIQDGEDKLLIYNSIKDSSYEINGYSPNLGVNNLMLMTREEIKNHFRVLLCACTKYIDVQKNGILLVILQLRLGENNEIKEIFYKTGNFEVHCFCQILKVENKNDNYNNIDEKYRKNMKITDTEFFLVGGFDIDKKEGTIKLFKIIYGNKALDTKIKYIQDIAFEDREGFE